MRPEPKFAVGELVIAKTRVVPATSVVVTERKYHVGLLENTRGVRRMYQGWLYMTTYWDRWFVEENLRPHPGKSTESWEEMQALIKKAPTCVT